MRVRLERGRSGCRTPLDDSPAWFRPVALDEDTPGLACGGCGEDALDPQPGGHYWLRVRGRRYLDADGDPRFEWHTLGSGAGILRETRREVDDTSGTTAITGTLTISWPATLPAPTETATVLAGDGVAWNITAVTPQPGALVLAVERTEDAR